MPSFVSVSRSIPVLLMLLLGCQPLVAQPLPEALRTIIAGYEASSQAPLIPRRHLFPEQPVRLATLSPDGSLVLAGVRHGTTTRLSLLDTSSLAETPLFASNRLRLVWWTNDSRQVLLELNDSVGVLSLAAPHRPSYITRIDRQAGDYVLGPGKGSEEQVLIVRRAGGDYLLERIGLTGKAETVLRSSSRIEQALSGKSPDEYFLVLHDAEGQAIYRHADGGLSKLLPCGLPRLAACDLLAYDHSTETLWLNFNGDEDLAGLFTWSATTGELRKQHGDPLQKVDLYRAVISNNRPVVAAYYTAGLQHYALDPAAEPVLAALQTLLPEAILELSAGANGTWLVKQDAAVLRESRYFLFGPDQQLQAILRSPTTNPEPAAASLSARHYLEYSASDQLLIKAYVSFPKGVDVASAPLVALIHGGPWGRVDASYSHFTQLLVNRGYVVFEPNFRASTGYGRHYVLAAKGDFGNGRVQQDITDGVHYLLKQGIGDPAKVAIAGASFGGFAVLSGLAFTPELYRVGVALVPPAELAHTLRYSRQQSTAASRPPSNTALMARLAGDVDDPAVQQRFVQQSPLTSLDAITAPLLMIAGADDDRIDIRQVKDFALRLLNQGSQLSLLIDEDEGHGLLSDDASEASLFLLEEMLALNLGGRREGLDDPLLQQYLQQRLLLNTNAGFLAELEAATR